MNKIRRKFFYLLYYYFARFLPPTHRGILGQIGGKIRYCCAKELFDYCGKNVNIEHMANFGNGKGIEIGDNSGIGIHCYVAPNTFIGKDVMMGPHCHIMYPRTHTFDSTSVPIRWQGSHNIEKRTIISDGVWMGRQCIMLPGKTIGVHSIIGAGSVICKDVPEYVIVGGNPIRIIRKRK